MKNIELDKYGYYRVAASTPIIRVADVEFNKSQHIEALEAASDGAGAQLMVFPELSLTGYTAADLFFQQNLLEKSIEALVEIATECRTLKINAIVGLPISQNGRLFNAAAFISGGMIVGIVPKTFLCNADEYYEERWFTSANDAIEDSILIDGNLVPFGNDIIFQDAKNPKIKIGIEICEDLWVMKPPSSDLASAGCSIICNLSASNEYIGKTDARVSIVESQSKRIIGAYVYASSGPTESSTDTVFSGHSMVFENGEMLEELEKFKFESDFSLADIDIDLIENQRRRNHSFTVSKLDKVYRIIKIQNYFGAPAEFLERQYKTCPYFESDTDFMQSLEVREVIEIQKTALSTRLRAINCKNVVVGLSGGLDSTLALLIILESFKQLELSHTGIHVITMPGFGTSERTRGNAEKLCEALDIECKTINIDKAVRQHFDDIGHDEQIKDVTYENSQARERTQILMDYANKVCGIVIGTGDMSEIALGWSTYNGDQMSMYNPNSGVPKTIVQKVVKYFADEIYYDGVSKILTDVCDTPISPELLPTDAEGDIEQKTEDTIGPYELHDFFLYHVLHSNFTPEKIIFVAELAFEDKYSTEDISKWLKLFYRRFITQQFKRSAIPDGPKVFTISLSPRAQLKMPSDASFNLWKMEK
ncbi:MAG: NAD(+) synthase [Bacteroidetes bacterium 4572_77]|nr:MAG: NAD(+) synthase [Bacteroidetes bacterium 4572_77]